MYVYNIYYIYIHTQTCVRYNYFYLLRENGWFQLFYNEILGILYLSFVLTLHMIIIHYFIRLNDIKHTCFVISQLNIYHKSGIIRHAFIKRTSTRIAYKYRTMLGNNCMAKLSYLTIV